MKVPAAFLNDIVHKHGNKISFSFHSCDRSLDGTFFKCIRKTILEFLSNWWEIFEKNKNNPVSFSNVITFFTILWEAIKNASDHGNDCCNNKVINVTIWIGEKGLAASIKDQGNFFKNNYTKFRLENKLLLETEWKQRTSLNCNVGLETIQSADKLFIDTKTGTLYILWMFT